MPQSDVVRNHGALFGDQFCGGIGHSNRDSFDPFCASDSIFEDDRREGIGDALWGGVFGISKKLGKAEGEHGWLLRNLHRIMH